jgi:hypothetical protein
MVRLKTLPRSSSVPGSSNNRSRGAPLLVRGASVV